MAIKACGSQNDLSPLDLRDLRLERMGSVEFAPAALRRVVRRRLFDVLSATSPGGVALVSGPAGSGKTTLLRSWVDDAVPRDHVAWVAVERDERDAQRFWRSVLAAMNETVGGVQEPTPAPIVDGDAVVKRLVADLRTLDHPVVLVIDDVHELRSDDATAQLAWLLSRMPPTLRVVLATRHDLPPGLHRLRVAGVLTELRAPDLRFALDETRELLAADRIELSESDIALLHERTEGWVAGLRLAALSIVGHPEPQRFVEQFAGSERTVADYLLAEILDRQPENVRHLLMRTSIVERVNGSLADCLTGDLGSERILQDLEETNAFVESGDVARSWFRYHPLFAELLQRELRHTFPEEIDDLHRKAAKWFQSRDEVLDAVRHAQRARDWSHAAQVLAQRDVHFMLEGRGETIRALVEAFPENFAAGDAELARIMGDLELDRGSLDRASAYYAAAGRLAPTVPDHQRRRFDAALALPVLSVACRRGDFAGAAERSRTLERALDALDEHAPSSGDDLRALALMKLGHVELWSGHYEDARRDLAAGLELAIQIDRPYIEIRCLGFQALATRSFVRGARLSAEAIEIARRNGWGAHRLIAQAIATHGLLLAWMGRFAEAEAILAEADQMPRGRAEPGTALLLHHALGLLHAGQRRLPQALAEFRAAETMSARLASDHFLTAQLRSCVLQTQARLGETAAVREQLANDRERLGDELALVTAAVELADDAPDRAIDALGSLTTDATDVADPLVVQALVLTAIAQDQLGRADAAQLAIEHALQRAEGDAIILPFALVPTRSLLARLPHDRTAVARFKAEVLDVLEGLAPTGPAAAEPPREVLSDGEQRVLRYLPSHLSAPEIASELHLSVNTVRTHIKHIYAKLDSHDRAGAVARAVELGLLHASSGRR
jgi:LuxR family maltose regulon positive regulatory protein